MEFNGGISDALLAGIEYLNILKERLEEFPEETDTLRKIENKLEHIKKLAKSRELSRLHTLEKKESISVIVPQENYEIPDGKYMPWNEFLIKIEKDYVIEKVGKILNVNSYLTFENGTPTTFHDIKEK